jgi:DNA invertase Pin-like site-specific DNA recombinase
LEAVLDFIRSGDVFVVTKIDRLARSVADLCAIVKRDRIRGSGQVKADQKARGRCSFRVPARRRWRTRPA